MSAQKRAETEQALQQEQQILQSRQQQAGQALQQENQILSQALTKKVDSFVADYATSKRNPFSTRNLRKWHCNVW